jgi:hypothetical protein
MVLELDASATAARLWGLNGDSAYIYRMHQISIKVINAACLSTHVFLVVYHVARALVNCTRAGKGSTLAPCALQCFMNASILTLL